MSKKKFGLMEDMGELQFKMMVEETISSVINTYYLIVQAKQQLQVDQEAVSISEERLKIAENNLQIGAGSGLEVLQAKVDLNTDGSASIKQKVVLENTKIQLNQLLSRPVETRFDVQQEIELKPRLQLPEIQELTERQNKQIQLKFYINYISFNT